MYELPQEIENERKKIHTDEVKYNFSDRKDRNKILYKRNYKNTIFNLLYLADNTKNMHTVTFFNKRSSADYTVSEKPSS